MKVTFERQRGWENFPPVIDERNQSRALESFVIYELGYGGQVTHLSETSVTVKTNVMGCVDTTTFSVENDKKDELKPFFEIVSAHNQIKSIKSLQEKNIDQVMKVTNGNPLMVKLGAGMIMGNGTVFATLKYLMTAQAFDDREPQPHELELFFEKLKMFDRKNGLSDLLTAWLMVYNKEATCGQALELAA